MSLPGSLQPRAGHVTIAVPHLLAIIETISAQYRRDLLVQTCPENACAMAGALGALDGLAESIADHALRISA